MYRCSAGARIAADNKMHAKKLSSFFILAFTCTAGISAAEKLRFNAGAHSDLPLSVGGRVGLEFPGRFRIASSMGFLPGGYINTINSIMVNTGSYTQSTADLIHSTLKSSLVWRIHGGFRPFENYGFHVEAGYGLIALGGGASAAEIISGTTGATLSDGGAASGKTFTVNSTLHMLDIELGWEWFWNQVYFRASVGGAFTVASSTSVTANYKATFPRITEAFAVSTETYLNDIYSRYVHTPTVSFTVGYSFF
jgi:hypothetical protein